MTDTITSARVRELSAKATGGEWDVYPRYEGPGAKFTPVASKTLLARVFSEAYGDVENEEANAALIAALCSEPARDRIARALDLLERVEAGDAGLVETVARAASAHSGIHGVGHNAIRAALAALAGR